VFRTDAGSQKEPISILLLDMVVTPDKIQSLESVRCTFGIVYAMSLQVLIIGDADRAEAAALMEWIPVGLLGATWTQSKEMHSAIKEIERTNQLPDLIVVIQSQPDEYCRAEIDSLGSLAPLARWVVCCGAWCESEGRTRQLWPLASRVPLRSAISRIQQEWRTLRGENVSMLPPSGSREEVFAADHSSCHVATSPVLVLVDSADVEYARYLRELLVDAGHEILEMSDGEDRVPQVLLCDLDPWEVVRQQRVHELQERYPFAQIVGLMSMPEAERTGDFPVVPKLGSQQLILDAIQLAVAD
jgi:hypothetical protein